MSTTKKPLKYLWNACFEDGHIIYQPADDRYSKHDDNAEYNPSAFRDILDYSEKSPLLWFALGTLGDFIVYLYDGHFCIKDELISLETEPLSDRKLIFYRQVQQEFIGGEQQEPYVSAYVFGYEGKNANNKIEKKVIKINA